jgi:hypothetical protein
MLKIDSNATIEEVAKIIDDLVEPWLLADKSRIFLGGIGQDEGPGLMLMHTRAGRRDLACIAMANMLAVYDQQDKMQIILNALNPEFQAATEELSSRQETLEDFTERVSKESDPFEDLDDVEFV